VAEGPAIVHLIGFPGAGKLTVAREVARLGDAAGRRVVVVDNHLSGNPVLSVLDLAGGPIIVSSPVKDALGGPSRARTRSRIVAAHDAVPSACVTAVQATEPVRSRVNTTVLPATGFPASSVSLAWKMPR
jgi:hypothetical protein